MKLTNQIQRLIGIIVLCAAIFVAMPGCTTSLIPQAENDLISREAAAEIANKAMERAEQAWTAEASKIEPDSVKLFEITSEIQKLEADAMIKAAQVKQLTEQLKNAKASEKELLDAAEKGVSYLPSPFREMAVLALGIGVTWWRNKGQANALAVKNDDKLYNDCEEARNGGIKDVERVAFAVINSVGKVLTQAQKDEIKHGPQATAMVQKAKGRV